MEKYTAKDAAKDAKDDYGTEEYCTCGDYLYDEHSCIYSEEVENEWNSMCTCCPYCEQQCLEDI